MKMLLKHPIQIVIAAGVLIIACEGRDTSNGYETYSTGSSDSQHSDKPSTPTAVVNKTAATSKKSKDAKAQSEKEAKQELREVKAREIGVLKNDIDEKREEISSRKNILFSLLNQQNQLNVTEIDGHTQTPNPTAQMVGAVANSGGAISTPQNYGQPGYYGQSSGSSGSNWVGPALSVGAVGITAFTDISNEKNQQATINKARQSKVKQRAELEAEIAQLEAELADLEDQLSRLIDPNDLVSE